MPPRNRSNRYCPELTQDWREVVELVRQLGIPEAAQTLRGEGTDPPDVAMQVEAVQRRAAARERDLKRRYAAALDANEALDARLNNVLASQDFDRTFNIQPNPDPSQRDAIPIIPIGDWHAEERIDRSAVNGLNEYNPDIAQERANKLFANVVKLIDMASSRNNLVGVLVHLQGDFITGYIHEELMEDNYLSPIEAMLLVQGMLYSGLTYLATKTGLPIKVHCSYGNHGRTTPKRRISTGYKNSYEWLMFNTLAQALRGDSRIEFSIPRAPVSYDTFLGYTIRFTHGDLFRYAGGIGGITIPLIKWVMKSNQQQHAHYTLMGHWHQHIPLVGSGVGAWINPSLIGFGPYSQAIGAPPEPPAQSFAVLVQGRGLTLMTPVFVT